MLRTLATIITISAAASCTQFPEVDAAMLARENPTEFPDIAPLSDIISGGPEQRLDDLSAAQLEARAAALRLRADRLRRVPILSAEERAALQEAAARYGYEG